MYPCSISTFKWPLFLSFFSLFPLLASAQKDYFQQEVNYTIDVKLDDSLHTLTGNIQIEYINNAPVALDTFYMHVWPNAYKDQSTAFAKQQLEHGQTAFYFAESEDYGSIEQLDFKVAEKKVAWRFDKTHPDIALLLLSKPLESGDTIQIESPFQVKIPKNFSRLGHVGQSYQFTQWYPKPAVFDTDGWHPMPYLNMGEYYAEFGSFDVKITLPKEYVVAATGTLETASEIEFLKEKMALSNALIKAGDQATYTETSITSGKVKTIQYKAEKVHDFAWFADKSFVVQKKTIAIDENPNVEVWTFYPPEDAQRGKNALQYVARSLKFYSDLVGPYPYPQATVVQGPLIAGSGMEYPMITIIEPISSAGAQDILITHEVGHNWFYGILGFNERDHAWLDEGINSYYEHRYSEQFYGDISYDFLPELLTQNSEIPFLELAYLYQARRELDQAPETSSKDLTRVNYLLSAYQKPAAAFLHLERYLGQDTFDQLMQGFYQSWKFKHPQPKDLRAYLELESGKNLSWLFDGYLYSNEKLDYALTDFKVEKDSVRVDVANKGTVEAPFPISGLKDGKVIHTQWYEGFKGQKSLGFKPGTYDAFIIDKDRITIELRRQNNFSKKAKDGFQLQLIPGVENDKASTLYWLPAVAWNNYDKLMLGGLFYNTVIPSKPFQFILAPMYGTNSKDLAGWADLSYTMYSKNTTFQSFTLGASIRSANFNYNARDQYFQAYAKTQLSLKAQLRKIPTSNYHHFLKWRSFSLATEQALRDGPEFLGTDWENTFIHELSYEGEQRRKLNPFYIKAALEQQSYTDAFNEQQNYLKLSLEWIPSFTYKEGKNFTFRFFGGAFLSNSKRNGGSLFPGAFNMIGQGFYDYRFDEAFWGRTEGTGIFSQQIAIQDGGFKNTIGQGFSLGRTNNFLIALNTKVDIPFDLPLNLPLKAFFDMGYFDNAMPTGMEASFSDQFLWSGGFMIEWLDGLIGVYFPLVNTQAIQDRYIERGNFLSRISFSIDIAKLNPYYQIERIEF